MIEPLSYSIPQKLKVNWSESQTKSISRDFPFDPTDETDEQFVARTYLQFLWLPESIMPLRILVPSLSRVSRTPDSTSVHPLHEYLRPLLQTTRSIASKYNTELPNILRDGGGAGEIEETMMWFALNHAKADGDLWETTKGGPWEDDNWRKEWIERMERREVQVQILLYFLKLSLPGPRPKYSIKKRKWSKEPEQTQNEDEAALESLFDRLSMWQLMIDVDNTRGPKTAQSLDQEQDWMQKFYTEIVSPQFQTLLPELCSLFYSKIFPTAYFSSSEPPSPSSSRAATPDAVEVSAKEPDHKKSTRHASPALSTTSTTSTRQPHRSRSLSVSLAEERAMQRERSIGPPGAKKRVLNREVSMSRAFKSKLRQSTSNAENANANRIEAKKKALKRENPATKQERDLGVTLVEATPTKPRKARTQSQSQSQINLFGGPRTQARTQSVSSVMSLGGEDGADGDEWQLSSSPALMSIFGGEDEELTDIDEDEPEDGGTMLVDTTPTKRKRVC